MRKKCFIMAIVSMVMAFAIYGFTYCLYHYLSVDGGFGPIFHSEPVKPLVTFYFGLWGVMHQFAAFVSLAIGLIFFPKEKKK